MRVGGEDILVLSVPLPQLHYPEGATSAEQEIIARLDETVEIIRPAPEVRAQMKARTKPVYDFFVTRGDYTWDDINAAMAASQGCGQE